MAGVLWVRNPRTRERENDIAVGKLINNYSARFPILAIICDVQASTENYDGT